MYASTFGRSIVFAAGAALGMFAVLLFVWPLLGGPLATSLWFATLAPLYLLGIAPTLRRGLVAAALGAAICGAALVVTRVPTELALAATLAIGLGRAVLLFRRPPLRALLFELGLGAGALGLAFAIGDPGRALTQFAYANVALGVWAYFLIQSCWFLVGDAAAPQLLLSDGLDPFDRAQARAERILETV